MYDILKFSEEERRTIFRNTAQKMGVHEAIIEKDYWVCLILDYLFHKSKFQQHLAFKGGTSLSKCFNLIKRFSEDIDLVLDWRLLGYKKDEPWHERSKTKQDAFNKEANTRTEEYLANEILPDLISGFSKYIDKSIIAEIANDNPQTIYFYYPQLFGTEYLFKSICLEIGALAAWTPTVERIITPYVFEYYPKLTKSTSVPIVTSSVERTFWEKAAILHHEAHRPEHLDMPKRYSRHYYDLYCIANTEYKTAALTQYDLFHKVIEFRMKFYPRAWAKYEEAVSGAIKLIPPHYRLGMLRNDYLGMSEMLFGEHPHLNELLEFLQILEKEINQNFPFSNRSCICPKNFI